jgi:hypothetical protein
VAGASAGHPARKNLAAVLNEGRENLGLFVIDVVHFVDAEPADFLLADEVPFAALRRTAGTPSAAALWAWTGAP